MEEANDEAIKDVLKDALKNMDKLQENMKTVSYTHLTLPTSDLV